MERIRKGDQVVVTAGNNKGKRGIVQSRVDADYVLVDGINLAKKHTKPNPVKGVVGGILNKTMPIHVSNVALYNPETKKSDRVGFKLLENGKKVRIFKSSGKVVGG